MNTSPGQTRLTWLLARCHRNEHEERKFLENCTKALPRKLQNLENKVGRIITGDNNDMASDILRTKFGWDTRL